MGLYFSHGNARWSYSGFNSFRERLAKIAGFDLREMRGFNGHKRWDKIKDPIKDLLNHSDCDDELTPEQCRVIAPRLTEMIKYWDDDDYDKQEASELIRGMEEAISKNESLVFE